MKVGPWEVTRRGTVMRFAVRVEWEDQVREAATIWFECADTLADRTRFDANVALLSTFPLAMSTGERRLSIEGAVPPRLADGVRMAMDLLALRSDDLLPAQLDVSEVGVLPAEEPSPRRAALCLSGGVDAMAALQSNLDAMPAGHPARFRYGLFVFGLNSLDFADGQPVPARVAAYEAHAARLEACVAGLDISLLRVSTNLRSLYPSFDAWATLANNTPLAAIGHALRPIIDALAIGSTGFGVATYTMQHPSFMDALFATHDLDVHPAQPSRTRLEKVRRLAAWPDGLAVLRVCFLLEIPRSGLQNCGHCEKCVRTKLALLVAGGDALARAPFPAGGVTAAQLDALPFLSRAVQTYYDELVDQLSAIDRTDLVAAIQRAFQRFDAAQHARVKRTGWRGLWRRTP